MSGLPSISKFRPGRRRSGSNSPSVDRNVLLEQLKNKRKSNLDVLWSQKNPAKKTTTFSPMETEDLILDEDENLSSSIETSNRFNPLTDASQGDQFNEPKVEKAIKSYTPPIIIQQFTYNQVCDVLKSFKITVFQLKIMNIGIKISNLISTDYVLVKEYLVQNKIQHYTHSTPDKFPLKVILAGHPFMDIEFIKTGIVDSGIKPESIIEIIPLRKKDDIHPSHISYLVKFLKSAVRFHDLKRIKYVNNVVINWYPYKNTRYGPTQCRKCQMFGHGTSNCFRKAKCPNCSKEHSDDACTKLDSEPFLCANCGENHNSTDPICNKRLEYLYIKENMSLSKKINHISSNNTQPRRSSVVFHSNARNHDVFPNLVEPQPSSSRRSFFNGFNSQHELSSQSSRNHLSSSQHQNLESSSYQIRSPTPHQTQSSQKFSFQRDEPQFHNSQNGNNSKNTDLFSVEELGSLITDISQIISSCETRVQQFEAIALLSLKYFYNGSK